LPYLRTKENLMRRFLRCSIALISAGPAFAGDLLSRKDAPVYLAPTPAFSWTGFYVGADIGAALASTSVDQFTYTHRSNDAGILGGGYVGYNYQVSPNFVLGVEGDFQGATSDSSLTDVSPPFFGKITNQQNWLAAINGRLGVAYDRALFYAIGGAAWTQDRVTSDYALLRVGAFNQTFAQSTRQNLDLSGFDVGGGVESAIYSNWIGRVEYRYYDFGPYAPQQGFTGRERTSINTVRVGLAYLFSAPAPVIAKY
jgi:outer membrane immunogenic protein